MKVINGENLILGRLASYIAKQVLLGEEITLVNCEKIMVSGDKKQIFAKHKQKQQRGHPRWGPFTPRRPDSFVKRSIRGMVPRKKTRGRDALKKIKCYVGVPNEFKDAQLETLEKINVQKIPNLKYVTVGDICKILGGKWQQK
ncbi:MAG: 50S ribosomal protein L13 [Nanoarchaeota archaeon]|nr:50S ribosomal protein L13 [Nanoarchaeota archaeon]